MNDLRYPHLFRPIEVGSLIIPNRIVHQPTDTSSSNADGSVSERDIHHHQEIAKGGTGLIIVGATTPDAATGRPTVGCLVADGDNYIPGLARLAEVMHRYGARCMVQLQHPGPKSSIPRRDMFTTNDRVSRIFWGSGHEVVYADDESKGTTARGMSTNEVLEMVDLFSEAAWRVRQAGFDGVELHAAHGYLISDFMSPYLNRRDDRFGVSFENRMRFPLAIVASIQKKCGRDFSISVRFNAVEFTPGGRDLEEAIAVAQELERAGVACINVSTSGAPSVGLDPIQIQEGWNLHISEAIRKRVRIPVLASHTLRNPAFCDRALAEGKADMVGLSRQLLADPWWPTKAFLGRESEIRRCISCLEGCWQDSIMAKREIACTINPACGDMRFTEIEPAQFPLKVGVVGGGPAGMEAARIASLRGHSVTLFERSGELGGAILGCCLVDGKEKIRWYTDWIRDRIRQSPVHVELNHPPSVEELRRFDYVIDATGARSVRPRVPGAEGAHVLPLEAVMTCPKVSCEFHPQNGRKPVKTGERVLVWGDHYPAADTAAHLARIGRRVTIVTSEVEFGAGIEVIHRWVMNQQFKVQTAPALETKPFRHPVEIVEAAEIVEIRQDRVVVLTGDLKTREIEADTVVCCRMQPDGSLHEELRRAGIPTIRVGDAVSPRNLHAAVREGAEAGLMVDGYDTDRGAIVNPNGRVVNTLSLELRQALK